MDNHKGKVAKSILSFWNIPKNVNDKYQLGTLRVMSYFQPRWRIYKGLIELDAQPLTWIKKHRSFASREWIESQVRYGAWMENGRAQDCFIIVTDIPEGRKILEVSIQIEKRDTYVLVRHCHAKQRG